MEKAKLSLFTDVRILYLTDPENSTKRLLYSSKVTGYKVNLSKSVVFYMSTMNRLRHNKKTIPFIITSKNT
jgi:hypothetical protein